MAYILLLYPDSYKSLPAPHQAPWWLIQGGRSGGTGEGREAAAAE